MSCLTSIAQKPLTAAKKIPAFLVFAYQRSGFALSKARKSRLLGANQRSGAEETMPDQYTASFLPSQQKEEMMQQYSTPVRFSTLPCARCAARVYHPRWARIGYLHYQALCWSCFATLDLNFTADRCISQARAIVRSASLEAWL